MVYQLTTDGSRSENMQDIGYAGYISNDSGKILFVFYEHRNALLDNINTNLFEFYSLVHGLESALAMGVREIACYNDSLTLIKDCIFYGNADYDEMIALPNKKYLIPLIELIQQFDHISFHHLPRIKNQYSDYLSHIWRNQNPKLKKEFFDNFISLGGNIEYDFFEMAKRHAIDLQEEKGRSRKTKKSSSSLN